MVHERMRTLRKASSIVRLPDLMGETNQVNLLFGKMIIDRCEKLGILFADFSKHLFIDVSYIAKKLLCIICIQYLEDRDRKNVKN